MGAKTALLAFADGDLRPALLGAARADRAEVEEYVIDTWIESWLDGSLQQPWLIYDPDSRSYRGATIEETRSALAADSG